MLTLDQQLKKEGFDNSVSASALKKRLIGKAILVTANKAGHCYKVGNKYKINPSVTFGNIGQTSIQNFVISGIARPERGGAQGDSIYFSDATLIDYPLTLKEFEAKLAEIKGDDEESIIKRKTTTDVMVYMQENEVGEFDPDTYEVFKVLRDNKNFEYTIEKAEEIVKMLKP